MSRSIAIGDWVIVCFEDEEYQYIITEIDDGIHIKFRDSELLIYPNGHDWVILGGPHLQYHFECQEDVDKKDKPTEENQSKDKKDGKKDGNEKEKKGKKGDKKKHKKGEEQWKEKLWAIFEVVTDKSPEDVYTLLSKIKPNKKGANQAAKKGYVEVLEWLKGLNPPPILPNKKGANLAAKEGHVDVLKWMVESSIPIDLQEISRIASNNSNTNVLDWIKEISLPDRDVTDIPIHSSNDTPLHQANIRNPYPVCKP